MRPTFYFNNKKYNEIRAGGIILYKIENNQKQFLMIKKGDKYEDFGGKTDIDDNTIEETVSREADEESNGIFRKLDIIKKIKKIKPIYCKQSKYIIYFIKTDDDYICESFGNKELYCNINRTVEWVPLNKIRSDMLHIRLRSYYFFKAIKAL